MAVYHDQLYVVGVFSIAGGVGVNNIAKWDGSRWCSLNTDFEQSTPRQIEVAKGELYISGGLRTINGDSVFNMAHWIGGDYVLECGQKESTEAINTTNPGQIFSLYPNPADKVLKIKSQGINSLFIYDVTGRLVKVLTGAELKCEVNISDWPSGFYYAKAVSSSNVISMSEFVKQ